MLDVELSTGNSRVLGGVVPTFGREFAMLVGSSLILVEMVTSY